MLPLVPLLFGAGTGLLVHAIMKEKSIPKSTDGQEIVVNVKVPETVKNEIVTNEEEIKA